MYHLNEIFGVAINAIMTASYFPSGRKGTICATVGDIVESDAIFAALEGSLSDVSLSIST